MARNPASSSRETTPQMQPAAAPGGVHAATEATMFQVLTKSMDRFVASIAEQTARAARTAATPLMQEEGSPMSATPRMMSMKVSWSQMPELVTSRPGEIDSWFMTLEGRLVAAQVPREQWAAKFMECPCVQEDLKTRIREQCGNVMDYALLRSVMLERHGPPQPTGFFSDMIWNVRGSYGDEVAEELFKWRALHNRAAEDHGRALIQVDDLIYPFIRAFPTAIAQRLRRKICLVMVQPEPLKQLINLAPIAPETPSATTTTPVHLIQCPTEDCCPGCGSSSTAVTKAKRRIVTACQAPVAFAAPVRKQARMQSNLPNSAVQGPNSTQSSNCLGCGGRCLQRNLCPAFDKTCFKCGKSGHFGNVCRNPNPRPPQQQQQNQSRTFPQRNFRFGPKPNGDR